MRIISLTRYTKTFAYLKNGHVVAVATPAPVPRHLEWETWLPSCGRRCVVLLRVTSSSGSRTRWCRCEDCRYVDGGRAARIPAYARARTLPRNWCVEHPKVEPVTRLQQIATSSTTTTTDLVVVYHSDLGAGPSRRRKPVLRRRRALGSSLRLCPRARDRPLARRELGR